MRALAAVLLATTVLAGCSNGTPSAAPASSSPAASPSATPARVGSVEDYAAAVRQFAPDIRRGAHTIDVCVAPLDCAYDVVFARATVGLFGEQMGLTAKRYGDPPTEIAALVVETNQAIDKAKFAEDDFHKGDSISPPAAAEHELVALLDRWAPYGV